MTIIHATHTSFAWEQISWTKLKLLNCKSTSRSVSFLSISQHISAPLLQNPFIISDGFPWLASRLPNAAVLAVDDEDPQRTVCTRSSPHVLRQEYRDKSPSAEGFRNIEISWNMKYWCQLNIISQTSTTNTTCWILRTLCMPHVKPAQRASKVSRLLRPTPHGPPLANCRRPLAEDQQLPCKALKLLPTLVQPWEGEMKGNVKHVSFPFKVTCIICIANPGVGLFDADRHAMYLRNYDGWWVNPQPTHLTNLQESRRRHKNRPWISTLETLAQYWNLELGFFSASNISI